MLNRLTASRRARRRALKARKDKTGRTLEARILEIRQKYGIEPQRCPDDWSMDKIKEYIKALTDVYADFLVADPDKAWVHYCIWHDFTGDWWNLDAEPADAAAVFSTPPSLHLPDGLLQTLYGDTLAAINMLRPGHVYIDVTFATEHDAVNVWDEVKRQREALEEKMRPNIRTALYYLGTGRQAPGPFIGPPGPGLRKGIQRRKNTVLRELDWDEVRQLVRANPRDISQIEGNYIQERVDREESRLNRQLTSTEKQAMGRKAIDSFYRQVVIHRTMQHLKLRIRDKGRPRRMK